MKNFKRITAIVLAFVIIALTIPTTSVFATDNDMNYGRTKLSGDSLYFYDEISDGCKAAKEEIMIDIDGHNIDFDKNLGNIIDMVYSDHPEYFWFTGSWSASLDADTLTIIPTYTMTGSELSSAQSEFDKKVNELTNGLAGKSDYEISKILHDTVIDTVTYNFTQNDQNAYGALVEGKAVCNGYTRAYQHLMKKVGIPAWYIGGSSINPTTNESDSHAWNIVKLNGNWYHTDVTWDDQITSTFYEYLNITTDEILEDHTIEDSFAKLMPKATSTDANYYKIEDRTFSKYNQKKLIDLFKKDNNKAHIYISGNVDNFFESMDSDLLTIGEKLGGSGMFEISYNATMLKNAVIINVAIVSEGHQHKAKTTVPQVDASCLVSGTKTYYVCECGLEFFDINCKKEISFDELVIPAKEHTMSSTWTSDGTNHWHECTSCGSETVIARIEHTDKDEDQVCDICNGKISATTELGNNSFGEIYDIADEIASEVEGLLGKIISSKWTLIIGAIALVIIIVIIRKR